MELLKMFSKLREQGLRKSRQFHYEEHLSNQRIRLERIARLLRCDPDEAAEAAMLMVEWLSGEGILKKGSVRPPRKRVQQQEMDDEIKMFLLQNGLCD